MKKSKKNEETALKKQEDQIKEEQKVKELAKKGKSFNIFGALMGGLFFISSTAGLFLLYKFQNRFTK